MISCRPTRNQNYPNTSLDEKCIEFEFRMYQKFRVELRVLLGFETDTCQKSRLRNLLWRRKLKEAQRRSQRRWRKDTMA